MASVVSGNIGAAARTSGTGVRVATRDCPACRDSGVRHVAWDHDVGSVFVACDCEGDDRSERRALANGVFWFQMTIASTIATVTLGYICLFS